MSKKALLVIDMLNDFVDPEGALYVGDTVKNIIPEIQKKIAQYRSDKDQIIYVCDNHDEDDREFELFPKHGVAGSRGAEIYKDFRPEPDDIIIHKKRFSSFYNTKLDEVISENDIDTLELMGVCTNICILYTCADAHDRDLKVIVDRRCVDTFDRSAHEFALKEMDRVLGAKII
ncbi:cysteine hydrolase family protein [bacterium]